MALPPAALLRLRYVDLLKRSLLGLTHADVELRLRYLRACVAGTDRYDLRTLRDLPRARPADALALRAVLEGGNPLDASPDELPFTRTMVGRRRLEQLETAVQTLLREGIPGDLVECGVWRGGASVFLRGLLEAHQDPTRRVWVADSFQGLPPASTAPDRALEVDLTEAAAPLLAVDLETVREAFEVHGLLDDRVRFVPGWFRDSLPGAGIAQIALLRLDGDLYESTRDALEALWDRVSPGGVVVIDDWVLPPCRQAVEEFLGARGGVPELERVDWAAVAFRKR